MELTRGPLATQHCISNLVIVVLGNGLAPSRRKAIAWTNDNVLSVLDQQEEISIKNWI